MDEKIEKLITHQVKKGITKEKMCKEIGITARTLRNIETQSHEPFLYTSELIDKYLNKIDE
jgi:DNA-binding XRE family transcriptional regulator